MPKKALVLNTYFIATTALLLLLGLIITTQRAHAAYDGSRIIDNQVFLDATSMSPANIQSFLVEKGSGLQSRSFQLNCYAADSQERQWYTAVGAPCDQVVPASQIIYYAAQIYGVNPKVILATLQKEQSLITSPNPTDWQINQAMGYGCPTTGGCGASTFFYQIDNATWVLRFHYERARGNMSWWRQGTSWTCGTEKNFYKPNLYPNQNVTFYDEDNVPYRTYFLQNAATSSFYCYTPHAYNNPQGLYGRPPFGTVGRYYSGSYNFVTAYEAWFGLTTAPTFSWQPISQAAFTDATKSTGRGLHNARPGERIYLQMTVRNTGNFTWSNSGSHPVRVGTLRPTDRTSAFIDNSWLNASRPTVMRESLAAPGEVATFEFWIKVPATAGGAYNEHFGLVSEGNSWFPDQGLRFSINVIPASYTWQLISQYAATDETNAVGRSLINLEPGERVYVSMRIRNTGNMTWTNTGPNPLHLGITRPTDRLSPFFDDDWIGQNRPAKMQESSVAPGEIASFGFWMKVPDRPGPFFEYFTPLVEGVTWMQDIGLNYYGTIRFPEYYYTLHSQYAYADSSKTQPIGLHNLNRGSTVYVGFKVYNTSSVTWYKNGMYPIRVGTSRPVERKSPFFADSWLGQTRPARMMENSVAPGQIATFEYEYKAPQQPGNYLEYVNLVAEGKTWMPDIGINFNAKVL